MQGRNRAKRTKILNRDMEIHLLTVLRGKGERERRTGRMGDRDTSTGEFSRGNALTLTLGSITNMAS